MVVLTPQPFEAVAGGMGLAGLDSAGSLGLGSAGSMRPGPGLGIPGSGIPGSAGSLGLDYTEEVSESSFKSQNQR